MDIQIIPFPLSIERTRFLKAPRMLAIAHVGRVKRLPPSPKHITSLFPSRHEVNFQGQKRNVMHLQHDALLAPFKAGHTQQQDEIDLLFMPMA